MNQVAYHNKTDKPMHMGAVTVMPNQTRLVDSVYVVKQVRAEQPAPVSGFDLEAYMAQNQTLKLKQLPGLNVASFIEVCVWCKSNAAPKLLEAAIVTKLEALPEEDELVVIAAFLKVVDANHLGLALLDYGDKPAALALVQAELSERGLADDEEPAE